MDGRGGPGSWQVLEGCYHLSQARWETQARATTPWEEGMRPLRTRGRRVQSWGLKRTGLFTFSLCPLSPRFQREEGLLRWGGWEGQGEEKRGRGAE